MNVIQYKIFSLLIFLFVIEKVNSQQITVTTSRGTISGYHFNQGSDTTQLYYGHADIFLGVPFAQPPIGSLRFAKTQKLTRFPVIPYNATYERNECIQGSEQISGMSEDCLYLNIYTPEANSTNKYPVMVYIHGGGLLGGNNIISISGTVRNLVSKGVVVVSIQYRLGFLGFFTTFTDDFPPNLGMLDQVEALRFIQEEISNFGGDPNKVTIFGQSAGSASVSAHTYSPLSQNLFQQSIQESGAVLTCFEDALGPTYRNFQFAKQTCNFTLSQWNSLNYGPLRDCLMNISVNDGLKAQNAFGGGNAACWNFVQDNYFLPDVPRNLYKNRTNKPVMIGVMKDEEALVELMYYLKPNYTQLTTYTKAYVENRLKNTFGNFFSNQAQNILEAFENTYLGPTISDDDHMAWLQFLVDVGSSFLFTSFSAQDVYYHLWNNNSNVFVFEFTYSSQIEGANDVFQVPGWHPVPHGAELVYLFYTEDWDGDLKKGKVNQTDLEIADFFGNAWTNFAKYGKPTMDNTWKATTSTNASSMEYFEIGANSGMRAGFRKNDQITFNQILPKFIGKLPQDMPDYNNGSLLGCPQGWTKSAVNSKHCYIIFSDALTDYYAQANCEQNLASLISIDNAFENRELLSYITSNTPNCTKSFIGLVRSGLSWTWNNGDTNNYTNWDSGYPNWDSGTNCVVINSNDGKWSNQDCNLPQCYICGFGY